MVVGERKVEEEEEEEEEEMGGCGCGWSERVKAPLGMLLVQLFQTGMLVLSKLALSQGMFVFSLLTYRNLIGALCVAPFAFFREREVVRQLSRWGLMWIFINAFFGLTMAMGLYYYGLRDTTAAYATTFINMIPIVTFIFSVVLRIESLKLGSRAGKVKVMGTFLCVGGAMVISLYKGKALQIWPFHVNLSLHSSGGVEEDTVHNFARGTALLVGSCLCYACWFIVQVKMYRVFPSMYWATTLTCVIACFQAAIVGLLINRESSAWAVESKLQLGTILFSGLFNTAATFVLISWAISKRGPTYPSMFNPLSLMFVTIVESLFMGLQITIGSVLGVFLIVVGIYAFLWGKTKEMPERNKLPPHDVSVGDIVLISESAQAQSIVTPYTDPVSSAPQKDNMHLKGSVSVSIPIHNNVSVARLLQEKPRHSI